MPRIDGNDPNQPGSIAHKMEQQRIEAQKSQERELEAMRKFTKDNGCFVGRTKVLTPFGWSAIEELNVGDAVQSVDVTKMSFVRSRIKKIDRYRNRTIHSIRFGDTDAQIFTTLHHAFMTDLGWKNTWALKPGMRIFNCDDGYSIGERTILGIDYGVEEADVYNLITTPNPIYCVEFAVAHNFGYFRALRSFMTKVSDTFKLPEREIGRGLSAGENLK